MNFNFFYYNNCFPNSLRVRFDTKLAASKLQVVTGAKLMYYTVSDGRENDMSSYNLCLSM